MGWVRLDLCPAPVLLKSGALPVNKQADLPGHCGSLHGAAGRRDVCCNTCNFFFCGNCAKKKNPPVLYFVFALSRVNLYSLYRKKNLYNYTTFFFTRVNRKKQNTWLDFFFNTRLPQKKITRHDYFFTHVYLKELHALTILFARVYRNKTTLHDLTAKENITNFTENACMYPMCPPVRHC